MFRVGITLKSAPNSVKFFDEENDVQRETGSKPQLPTGSAQAKTWFFLLSQETLFPFCIIYLQSVW